MAKPLESNRKVWVLSIAIALFLLLVAAGVLTVFLSVQEMNRKSQRYDRLFTGKATRMELLENIRSDDPMLVRNSLVALEYRKDDIAVDDAIVLLDSRNHEISCCAACYLGAIGNHAALNRLRECSAGLEEGRRKRKIDGYIRRLEGREAREKSRPHPTEAGY